MHFPARSYARIIGANNIVRTELLATQIASRSTFPGISKTCWKATIRNRGALGHLEAAADEGVTLISESTGHHVALCHNNDELYDRKDIDAVIIATADFQHAQHGIEAVRNNVDAYVEKPTAHTMEEPASFAKLFDKLAAACKSARSAAARAIISAPGNSSSPASLAKSSRWK